MRVVVLAALKAGRGSSCAAVDYSGKSVLIHAWLLRRRKIFSRHSVLPKYEYHLRFYVVKLVRFHADLLSKERTSRNGLFVDGVQLR